MRHRPCPSDVLPNWEGNIAPWGAQVLVALEFSRIISVHYDVWKIEIERNLLGMGMRFRLYYVLCIIVSYQRVVFSIDLAYG